MTSMLALWTGLIFSLTGGPVTEVSIHPTAATTEIVIAVDGNVEYRDFTMEGPNRLVVDIFGARHQLPRSEFRDINRGGVLALRTSQYREDVVRLTLELGDLLPYEISAEAGSLRIRMENRAGGAEAWSSSAAAAQPAVARLTDVSVATSPATGSPAMGSPPAGRRNSTFTAPPQEQEVPRLTIEFTETPIRDVLFTFADFSGRSIVAGSTVEGTVTAKIEDQPWDQALDVILQTNGYQARALENGIIRVDNITSLSEREQVESVYTVAYKVNYATATEVAQAVNGILTQRGAVSASNGTNSVVVTDIQRVHEDVRELVVDLDRQTSQVTIQAKIVFVNRTDLNEFGVVYDLKDSGGNQLNVVTPGAADLDGDGVIELPDEVVPQGANVVALGGNSVAALGNAQNRVANPTLTLLSSLLIGRHTLVSFIEALQSRNLSDIQAAPSVTVLNNQQAEIQVGERTPLRVIDQGVGVGGGAGGQTGGGQQQGAATLPRATVQIEETGIILRATPHVTDDGNILLELEAERSSPQLAESDLGFIFQTQRATSRVLVRDGQTVVIGGLTVTEKSEVRSGIPFFMDLPLLGRLFRTTRESQIQRDLIILVTPHIVRDMAN
jgi:type IV pilus assembly protein PilQ